MIQAFDSDACELPAAYKAGVEAAIPGNVVCPLPAFWHELAVVVGGYAKMVEGRTRHSPKDELARARRIMALVDKLAKEMALVGKEDPPWCAKMLHTFPVLSRIRDHAASRADRYEVLVSRHFRGRADEHREFLYWGILNLWRHELGQEELRYSRDSDGTPSGPLVRFFVAVVAPVLGTKAPKASGIAKIVDRERVRRGYAPLNSKK
jgi:hypothetical protein